MLILAFLVSDVRAYAQGAIQLPAPGTRLALSPEFAPPLLKGIKVYRNDPFRFDFILDKGDDKATDEQIKADSTRLIKYFLASLTVPEKDLWVNLSPYEKDRIVPEAFGQTEMGHDLLAQDYILKQITASVIYPDEKVGKEFWAKVYAEALKRYGTTDVPVDTFNKVWIVPEKATVYENKDAAFVVESRLKVMLESDYLAQENSVSVSSATKGIDQLLPSPSWGGTGRGDDVAKNILREVIIPILEKEVNEGKNFATLRQVYNALILATWYKRKVKAGIMGQAYVGRQKTGGIDIADKDEKEKIWAQYVEAFRKGAYNLIKEEIDPITQTVVPRKYFSGGITAIDLSHDLAMTNDFAALPPLEPERLEVINMRTALTQTPASMPIDKAMFERRNAAPVVIHPLLVRSGEKMVISVPDRPSFSGLLFLHVMRDGWTKKLEDPILEELTSYQKMDLVSNADGSYDIPLIRSLDGSVQEVVLRAPETGEINFVVLNNGVGISGQNHTIRVTSAPAAQVFATTDEALSWLELNAKEALLDVAVPYTGVDKEFQGYSARDVAVRMRVKNYPLIMPAMVTWHNEPGHGTRCGLLISESLTDYVPELWGSSEEAYHVTMSVQHALAIARYGLFGVPGRSTLFKDWSLWDSGVILALRVQTRNVAYGAIDRQDWLHPRLSPDIVGTTLPDDFWAQFSEPFLQGMPESRLKVWERAGFLVPMSDGVNIDKTLELNQKRVDNGRLKLTEFQRLKEGLKEIILQSETGLSMGGYNGVPTEEDGDRAENDPETVKPVIENDGHHYEYKAGLVFELYPNDWRTIEKWGYLNGLNNRTSDYLVRAYDKNKLVGVYFADMAKGIGHVARGAGISVDPSYQQQGIGAHLFREMLVMLKGKGYKQFIFRSETSLEKPVTRSSQALARKIRRIYGEIIIGTHYDPDFQAMLSQQTLDLESLDLSGIGPEHKDTVPGGIDLDPSKIDMTTKNTDEEIKFNIDAAMLQRLQSASGVTPVIVGIHALDSLPQFMNVQTPMAK